MKISAEALGNMMCEILFRAMDGELTSTRYGEIEMICFDQAEAALAIKRLLATKKKRIIINVKYD